jgi:hypothetical protein
LLQEGHVHEIPSAEDNAKEQSTEELRLPRKLLSAGGVLSGAKNDNKSPSLEVIESDRLASEVVKR